MNLTFNNGLKGSAEMAATIGDALSGKIGQSGDESIGKEAINEYR